MCIKLKEFSGVIRYWQFLILNKNHFESKMVKRLNELHSIHIFLTNLENSSSKGTLPQSFSPSKTRFFDESYDDFPHPHNWHQFHALPAHWPPLNCFIWNTIALPQIDGGKIRISPGFQRFLDFFNFWVKLKRDVEQITARAASLLRWVVG